MRVATWPGEPPVPENGVFVIAVATAPSHGRREAARAAVREALRAVLGNMFDSAAVVIDSLPGRAPRVLIDGAVRGDIGCSISHEEGLSLAAVNLRGAVGVDVMAVQDVPDWEAVARDYLGPGVTQALRDTPGARRPHALARAWSAREAQLKLSGARLSEWTERDAELPCRIVKLELALELTGGDGLVAALALALPAN